MSFSDVLLPIAPFTETPGTFVNAEGRVQTFHAVVKPQGDARPAWKVLRALANVLGLPGFEFNSAQEVLLHLHTANGGVTPEHAPSSQLSNACSLPSGGFDSTVDPCVADIYQLDSIVRRASSLQQTSDAKGIGKQEITA
jgi:NADH-quinone oxidoreductase subunit G